MVLLSLIVFGFYYTTSSQDWKGRLKIPPPDTRYQTEVWFWILFSNASSYRLYAFYFNQIPCSRSLEHYTLIIGFLIHYYFIFAYHSKYAAVISYANILWMFGDYLAGSPLFQYRLQNFKVLHLPITLSNDMIPLLILFITFWQSCLISLIIIAPLLLIPFFTYW